MISQDDIDGFRDEPEPTPQPVIPQPASVAWLDWRIYGLYMYGFTGAANALYELAHPVDEKNGNRPD